MGAMDDLKDTLHERGLRLTPQRELVLRAVQRLGHGTPADILAEVRTESDAVHASTVQRTLDVLERLHLVRHLHLSDKDVTYHSTSIALHVHLVCRQCDSILDAEPDEFDSLTATLRQRHGFEVDLGHLTIFGTCATCLTAAPGSTADRANS
jgi:Fur family ferric uptake transcriptional regulator